MLSHRIPSTLCGDAPVTTTPTIAVTRERWMALCFAVGSACFVAAPFGVYARLVGGNADSATYFAGSIPFTIGGASQTAIAWGDRRSTVEGRALLRSAAVQSVGTVFFNLTTLRALTLTPLSAHYDRLVWRPNALGSVCFLISGVIAYWVSPRRGWWPIRGSGGWWQPAVNLLGCLLFGVSAIAGFAQPRSGSLIGPRTTDWTTSLGAICFLICAVATLLGGNTFKSARLRRWEQDVERDIEALARRE
jgi:hypothetical protein